MVDGVTWMAAVVCPPGSQAYAVAPLAVKFAVCPEQMVEDEAVIPTVGVVVTVMVTVLTAPVHVPLLPLIL